MIKVLYLDHTPFWGGAERVLETHLKLLDKKRFLPLVGISEGNLEFKGRFEAAGVKVITFPFGKLKTLNPLAVLRLAKSVRAVVSVIRKNKINLVVTNTSRAYYTSVIAARLCGVSILVWVHDFFYIKPLFRATLPLASGVIWTSQAVRQFYSYPENGYSKVIYPENCFEDNLRSVSLEDVQKLREVWGVSEGDMVIGSVGRLVKKKGVQVLVRAVALLERSWPIFQSRSPKEKSLTLGNSDSSPRQTPRNLALKLVIVGTGQGQQEDNETEIKDLVKELGLEDRVIFIGFSESLAVFYKAFDIFAFPSTGFEAYPTVVVEAMLAGLPVVATRTGGTEELVENGKTGFLVPPAEAKALARALLQLYQGPGPCQAMGKAGREKALQTNAGRGSTRKMEKLFLEIVQSSEHLNIQTSKHRKSMF